MDSNTSQYIKLEIVLDWVLKNRKANNRKLRSSNGIPEKQPCKQKIVSNGTMHIGESLPSIPDPWEERDNDLSLFGKTEDSWCLAFGSRVVQEDTISCSSTWLVGDCDCIIQKTYYKCLTSVE